MQIRPLEEAYKFGDFFSSYLNESDFHAKPSVLLLGQYSTGRLSLLIKLALQYMRGEDLHMGLIILILVLNAECVFPNPLATSYPPFMAFVATTLNITRFKSLHRIIADLKQQADG